MSNIYSNLSIILFRILSNEIEIWSNKIIELDDGQGLLLFGWIPQIEAHGL